MKVSLVNALVSYGKRYQVEELGPYDPSMLASNWFSALTFFLNRASFQGRRDEVSYRVYQQIWNVLEPVFSSDLDGSNYKLNRQNNWEAIRSELQQRIGKGKVGKARDIEMVLSSLSFISNIPDYNIVAYSVQRIKRGELADHYRELQQFGNIGQAGIVQIGPKIASFYLRDVVAIYRLGDLVTDDDAFYLHPVDVWVRKLLLKTRDIDIGATNSTTRQSIVEICKEHHCSPVEFNQGAWYVGYYAFDLLLERLNEAD